MAHCDGGLVSRDDSSCFKHCISGAREATSRPDVQVFSLRGIGQQIIFLLNGQLGRIPASSFVRVVNDFRRRPKWCRAWVTIVLCERLALSFT
jgi:hypothetical protein